jgi:hypothetical protein
MPTIMLVPTDMLIGWRFELDRTTLNIDVA